MERRRLSELCREAAGSIARSSLTLLSLIALDRAIGAAAAFASRDFAGSSPARGRFAAARVGPASGFSRAERSQGSQAPAPWPPARGQFRSCSLGNSSDLPWTSASALALASAAAAPPANSPTYSIFACSLIFLISLAITSLERWFKRNC